MSAKETANRSPPTANSSSTASGRVQEAAAEGSAAEVLC